MRQFCKESGNFFFALRIKNPPDILKRGAMKHQALFHMMYTKVADLARKVGKGTGHLSRQENPDFNLSVSNFPQLCCATN